MYRTNRYRYLWIGLIVAGVVLLLASPGMMGMGFGMRPFFGAGPWFWGFGVLKALIWVGLIMLAIGWFRRASDYSAPDQPSGRDLSALEILKRRYAAGEISREQYDEMRRVLEPTAS